MENLKNATIEDIEHLERNLKQILSNQAIIMKAIEKLQYMVDLITPETKDDE